MNRVRNIFFFPGDVEYQEQIEGKICRDLRKTYRAMCMVIIVIQIFMAIVISSRPGGPMFKPRRTTYFVLYLLLIGISLLALAAERIWRKKLDENYHYFRGLSYAYMMFLCVWSVAITLNDQLGGNGLNVFVYMTITVAVLGMIRLWQSVVLFVGNFILLNALLPYFPVPSHADQSFNNLINSAIITLFSILVSAVFYRNRVMQEYDQIIISHQYQEIQRMNQKLSEETVTDQMTGLKNRRYLQDCIKPEFQKLKGNTSVTCMMLDIDYFKQYNDTYGHCAGDECLQFIADLLQREINGGGSSAECVESPPHLRSAECVVRLGGEEFTAFLFGRTLEEVREQTERIRYLIDTEDYRENEQLHGHVTISIGFFFEEISSGREMEEFVDMADRALYQAKNRGRNQVVESLA